MQLIFIDKIHKLRKYKGRQRQFTELLVANYIWWGAGACQIIFQEELKFFNYFYFLMFRGEG